MTVNDRWTGLRAGQRPFRDAAWFYAEYRYRPSEAFVRLLAGQLGWSCSDRVLDLGAGPAHVSLRLAPFVGEVVVMDPERAMLEEGRRRAAAAEIDNLLDRERGAVALVGYVKDPDYNLVWLNRPPWNAVEAIRRRHLAGVPERPNPAGRHDPFPEILARSAFSRIELLTHEYGAVVDPSVDAAIGFQYSLGNLLARLGERRAAFEADVRAALADADTSPLTVRLVDSALIGHRPRA